MDDAEFALHLSDIRLVQTMRLLEVMMGDHPDQLAVKHVVEAIRTTRDNIVKPRAALKSGD